jgi:hypothetical protein
LQRNVSAAKQKYKRSRTEQAEIVCYNINNTYAISWSSKINDWYGIIASPKLLLFSKTGFISATYIFSSKKNYGFEDHSIISFKSCLHKYRYRYYTF